MRRESFLGKTPGPSVSDRLELDQAIRGPGKVCFNAHIGGPGPDDLHHVTQVRMLLRFQLAAQAKDMLIEAAVFVGDQYHTIEHMRFNQEAKLFFHRSAFAHGESVGCKTCRATWNHNAIVPLQSQAIVQKVIRLIVVTPIRTVDGRRTNALMLPRNAAAEDRCFGLGRSLSL